MDFLRNRNLVPDQEYTILIFYEAAPKAIQLVVNSNMDLTGLQNAIQEATGMAPDEQRIIKNLEEWKPAQLPQGNHTIRQLGIGPRTKLYVFKK